MHGAFMCRGIFSVTLTCSCYPSSAVVQDENLQHVIAHGAEVDVQLITLRWDEMLLLLLLLSLYHIAQFTLLIFLIYSVAYYYEWWDSGDDYRGLHIDLWIKVQENKCEFVEWEDKVGFFLEASLHSNWTELNLLSLERLQFDLQSNKAVNVGKTEVMSPARILSIMWFIWKLLHTG